MATVNRRGFLLGLAGAAALPRLSAAADTPWRVGLATVDITPPLGVWMGGYAARKEPAQGIAQPLHAKAMAVADSAGHRAVVVTIDGKDHTFKADKAVDLGKVKAGEAVELSVEKDTVKSIKAAAAAAPAKKAPVGC